MGIYEMIDFLYGKLEEETKWLKTLKDAKGKTDLKMNKEHTIESNEDIRFWKGELDRMLVILERMEKKYDK